MKYFWRIYEVYVYFSLHGCEYLYCAQTYSTRVWEDTLPCMRTYVLTIRIYIFKPQYFSFWNIGVACALYFSPIIIRTAFFCVVFSLFVSFAFADPHSDTP